jgi:AraC-like DNA-binding protein
VFLLAILVAAIGRPPPNLRWSILLFSLSALSNLTRATLFPSVLPLPDFLWAERLTHFLGVAHPAWGLLVAYVMFEDRKLHWRLFIPAILLFGVTTIEDAVLLTALRGWGPTLALAQLMDVTRDLVRVAVFAWTAVVVFRTWPSDLVQWRRQLRWGLFAFTAVYGMFRVPGFWVRYPAWVDVADFWIQTVFTLASAVLIFRLRDDLVGAPRPAAAPPADKVSEAGRLAIARMNAAMARDELWRREGLTIADLATEAGVSERQLRRLINEKLGHRNFTGFLNSYRIDAAKTKLADPREAGRTIAEIAFDLGYASLGPFNRAFKEATGQTPSAFRKGTMADAVQERAMATPKAG